MHCYHSYIFSYIVKLTPHKQTPPHLPNLKTSPRPIRQRSSQPLPIIQRIRRIHKLIEIPNLRAILRKRQDERVLIPIRSNRSRRRTARMYDASVCLGVVRFL